MFWTVLSHACISFRAACAVRGTSSILFCSVYIIANTGYPCNCIFVYKFQICLNQR